MKKIYISVLASLLMLTGCSKGNTNSTVSSIDSVDSSEQISSSEVSISSEASYELVFGKEVDKIINEKFPLTIPSVGSGELITYSYKVDSFGDPTVFIYWDTCDKEVQEVLDSYYMILSSDGFEVTSAVRREYEDTSYYQYTVYYADKVVGDVGVEIQFLEGSKDGKECMGIYVFTYPYYDKNNWPSSVVVKLLGEDIPHLPENDYEYDAMLFDDEEGNIAKIIVYGAGYDEFYAYFDFFKAAGFLLPDPKLDANGKPVLDSDGNEIYEPKVDDDGNEYFLILEYNFKYGVRFYYDLNTYYALVIEIYSIFPETNN